MRRRCWPSEAPSKSYEGVIPIELPIKAVAHEGQQISNEEAAFNNYSEYGQSLMKLAEKVTVG
jgi:hypothetical protein